ncbi:Dehydrogenase, E1 component [Artemisia annua]|uniref:Dehydrogenase, E1 component n=1 Tax=Artemisia annua TaxID=35608 RepID=A0A2U1KGH2_ARTAN|nr:Dehydrogenase, E1 component [Artemisia annua]
MAYRSSTGERVPCYRLLDHNGQALTNTDLVIAEYTDQQSTCCQDIYQHVNASSYREPGGLLWRGFTLQEFAHQLFGNKYDLGKGRQMAVHYTSKKHN